MRLPPYSALTAMHVGLSSAIAGSIHTAYCALPTARQVTYDTQSLDSPRTNFEALFRSNERYACGGVVRSFSAPWSVEETAPCFIVRNANEQALAFVYCECEPRG